MGSLYKKGAPLVPKVHNDEKEHRRLLAEGVERALTGNLNNTSGSVRLNHNISSTTVSDFRAGPDSVLIFMGTNGSGSAALTRFYVDGQLDGRFVLNHASTTTSDATIKYAIFG